MKVFFDTSVLVAAFLEDHEHHARSFAAFVKADKKHACCAAHSLAELYSTLTRLPGKFRLSGEQALLFVDSVEERLEIVSLNAQEYHLALIDAAKAGVVGGMTYDALLARCALKARATEIYTWNVTHFQRLGSGIARRVTSP